MQTTDFALVSRTSQQNFETSRGSRYSTCLSYFVKILYIEMIRALMKISGHFFIGRSIDISLDSFHTYHSGLLVWYNVYVFAYLLTFQTYSKKSACVGTGERCFSSGRGKIENVTFPLIFLYMKGWILHCLCFLTWNSH